MLAPVFPWTVIIQVLGLAEACLTGVECDEATQDPR